MAHDFRSIVLFESVEKKGIKLAVCSSLVLFLMHLTIISASNILQ